MCIIYKATNLINGMCYIGKTICKLEKRKSQHIYSSSHLKEIKECIDIENKDKRKENAYFHRAINKYGIENFKWEVIFECDDELILGIMETMKIIVNHSHWTENGYNITWGNDSYPMEEETKRKISDALKKFYLTEKGKEVKKKLRDANMGRKLTEETKKKIGKSSKGRIKSEETRKKIGKGNKDKIVSEEARLNMSNAQKGRKKSEEHKQKLRDANIGKKHTEETRKKMSEAQKIRWDQYMNG